MGADSKRLLLVTRPGSIEEAEPANGGRQSAPQRSPNKPWVIDRYEFKQDVQGYLASSEHGHILLFDVGRKSVEALTGQSDYDEDNARWSPNGSKIAFVSNRKKDFDRTRNSDLFVADAKPHSPASQLTSSKGSDGGRLAWSADSKSIPFLQGTGDARYAFHSLNRLGIVFADGGTPRILTVRLDRAVSPNFSSDGASVSVLVTDVRVSASIAAVFAVP